MLDFLVKIITKDFPSSWAIYPSLAFELCVGGALPGSMGQLGNKADLTPSLLIGQAATGAVRREKLTMLLAFMVLLLPSRLQSPS